MRLDDGQIEVLDEDMARVLRSKSGAERLKIAHGLFVAARQMLTCHLRDQHPDWTQQRIAHEVARRLSHGAA